MKRIFAILLLLFTHTLNASTTNLAIVNKSFARDAKVSLRLYKSFERFVTPKIPFYVVVPQNDQKLFYDVFHQAKNSGSIIDVPVLVNEDEIFEKCGKSIAKKVKNMTGWQSQQVVKLCFFKLGLADNYFTIDSDTYFTKRFETKKLFFNNKARTYAPNYIQKNNSNYKSPIKEQMKKINHVLLGESTNYNNFIMGHAMWSAEILQSLEMFVQSKYDYDFADLISLVPLEMQWYGVFTYYMAPDKFFHLKSVFTLTDNRHRKKCIPTDGYPEHYGISYQYSLENSHINPCGSLKTNLHLMLRKIKFFLQKAKNYVIIP